MSGKNLLFATLAVVLCVLNVTAAAQSDLLIHPNGRTHYYSAVSAPGGITWNAAFDSARARGGYLATITSAAEESLAFQLVDSGAFWFTRPSGKLAGPWLGGYQPSGAAEPAESWQWLTGEPFNYQYWSPGLPDDPSGTRSVLGFGGLTGERARSWTDAPELDDSILGFVNEFSADSTTIGLFQYDSGTSPGYLLYIHRASRNAYLIDNEGRMVHKWVNPTYGMVAQYYLTEDGKLLHIDNVLNPKFWDGGRVGMLDWDGNEVWSYTYSDSNKCLHHDAMMMPNGNVLFLAYEYKSGATSIAAGRDPSKLSDGRLSPDHIVEVNPANDSIVWEWHAWDHLVQDFDSTKANYGNVAAHPELIDLNFTIDNTHDWLHCDGLNYNAEFDQILISVQRFAEVWVIDHSTTTAEARTHSGGRQGMGGDILYRWGNPQTYRAGTNDDRKFYGSVHAGNWIKPGLPGAGHILAFNGGTGRPGGNGSSVDEFIPACDSTGYYARPAFGMPFGPESLCWRYIADPPSKFFGPNMGGAQRLPNGNTLTAEATKGRFYEVTPSGDYVWRYMCPETDSGVQFQGDTIKHGPIGWESNSFRSVRYLPDYPGLVGRDLTPGMPVEKYRAPAAPPPAQLSPADNGIARSLTPTLRVGLIPKFNCDSVHFRLFARGGTTPVQEGRVAGTAWTAVDLAPGQYDWDCRARTASGWTRYSSPRRTFYVVVVAAGWSQAADVPFGTEARNVKDGGWLTYDPSLGRIYAAKGNKSGGFYFYDPLKDSWTTRSSWPLGVEAKQPKAGATGTSDGNGVIYAAKGNNTLGFWRYDAAADSWAQKAEIPLGPLRKKVKGGASLAYAGGAVYMLKGYKNEFLRYLPETDEWVQLTGAPAGASMKYDKGSWLAFDGSRYIYAFKAKYHEFYRFDLNTEAWSAALQAIPIPGSAGNKKAKDGSCGVVAGGAVYALKGNNTQEFWKYDIARDSWAEQETVPRIGVGSTKKRKVKAGADIVSLGSVLYATKGGNTPSFWRYGVAGETFGSRHAGNEGVTAEPMAPGIARIAVSPNPFTGTGVISYNLPVAGEHTLRLYDVTGALRATLAQGSARAGTHTARIDATRLSRGIYLLQLVSGTYRAARKLVLE